MTITCTVDIYQKWGKGPAKLMARAGDKMLLLHDGGTALVVQRGDGERFSTLTINTDYKNLVNAD